MLEDSRKVIEFWDRRQWCAHLHDDMETVWLNSNVLARTQNIRHNSLVANIPGAKPSYATN
ncbi:hypothetical protein Spb1_16570 [Planctopirus ephydatiae]|uniref:Uncharacterized protein n=1 Tax=Planctopirus ephydatiae TaxID=2528019 RepID=A0A518GM65_9PLAN|nr:hypothetical protein Spb1_16570 [Planctopirus ephydatiae]